MMWFKHLHIIGLGLLLTLGLVLWGCSKESPVSASDPTFDTGEEVLKGVPGPSYSSLPSQWGYAVYREAIYALSSQRYNANDWGASNSIICAQGGCWFAGDWNYMGLGVGIGGQCKTFVQTIVYRATGGAVSVPSGYNYATRDIHWVKPGDIIQRSDIYGTPHTAIVFDVLERNPDGSAKKIDVIDSNFVRSNTIARHILSMDSPSQPLWQYKVW